MSTSPASTPSDPTGAPAASVSVRDLVVAYDGTDVLHGVSLDVPTGSVLALLGPSGCGKTTLLRSIAGLERPVSGEVRVGDRLLSSATDFVAPERRRVGMVFQDWALFPHMTVAANVGYGLDRSAPRGAVDDALALVGLEGFGDRRPATLSGGQQQRVALARALAPRPSVLLLDEPFSNLDSALRVRVRSEVAALLAEVGITSVFVTHDQAEAFVLGDEVAMMRAGRIVQQASPAELYARPADAEVAAFVGEANLLPGTADGTGATTMCGPVTLREPGHGAVTVLARPEELRLAAADAPDASDAAGVRGVIRVVEFYGHDTVYVVDVAGATGDETVLRVRDSAAPTFRRDQAVVVLHSATPTVAWPR
jgi:iron(III) transport system ATP-binding protein